MIRIAYVIDHLRMGGAQRHLLQVVHGLDRRRYAPEMWTTSASRGELAADFEAMGVPVRSFEIESTLMSPKTLQACRRVAQDWRARDIHIVHAYLFEGNLLGTIAGKLSKRPVVLISKRSLDRYDRFDRRAAAWWCNRTANRVLVNAISVRNVVLEHEGCSPAVIEHIPNGVPLPDPLNLPEAAEPEVDPRGDGPLVGMVGRLGWKKGYEYALQAFAQLRDRIPGLRVDIVGDGDLRDELAEQVQQLGLASTVRFLGQQTDVARRMSGFDCYVLSSVIEGMPNALLEAMALGRPVVTTSAGGSSEVAIDGKSGMVVPPRDADALANAIERVLTDQLLAERISRGAASRVKEQFSEKAMLTALDQLYCKEMAAAGLKAETKNVEESPGSAPGERVVPN
ncbi:MAG: glycosyltransferase [Candidatus Binatia bacterium]|nr:glycosyltransferase [Candidatus Binatia bacterium]